MEIMARGGNSLLSKNYIGLEVGKLYKFGNKVNRNLLYNSTFKEQLNKWQISGLSNSVEYLTNSEVGNYIRFYTTKVDKWGYRIYSLNIVGNEGKGFKQNTEYTVSFYGKADKEAKIDFGPSNYVQTIQLSTEWKRYSIHCKNANGSLTIAPDVINVKYSISKIKIEEGNKVTKWCKAKEDN